jgi:hypothetical protein
MTDTSTTTRPTPRDLTGQLMADAARRMLPVIAGKVLAAAADRAVEGIEGLADRLEDLGAPAEDADADAGDTGGRDADAGGSRSPMSAAFAFVVEQARIVLRFLARLAAQAAEMLRRATQRLRNRRAPEGIDEAPAPEEISAPEDADDEYDDEHDDDSDDDVSEERAPAGV